MFEKDCNKVKIKRLREGKGRNKIGNKADNKIFSVCYAPPGGEGVTIRRRV